MHTLGGFFYLLILLFKNVLFESLLENLDFCFGLNVKYLLPTDPAARGPQLVALFWGVM